MLKPRFAYQKILYCGIASKYIHTMPAGWFLCEYLKERGIAAQELYHNVNEPLEQVASSIVTQEPDCLLLSVYIFNILFVKKLIERIRQELPDCKIIAGGPEADASIDADHIIIGEGEQALYGLLTEGGGRVITAVQREDLQGIPSPYTAERVAAAKGKLLYYESSRGCPFKCTYCMAGGSKGVRYFALDRVKADLINIVNGGARIIKFTDRTFNANTARTNGILRFIKEAFGHNRQVCFHFEVGGDLFCTSTLKLLAEMPQGLVQLEAGVQTLNYESLKAVNRVFDPDKFVSNIKYIMDSGNIHLHLDLIAGLPYETLPTFIIAFDAVYKLRPHMLQLGFLKFLKGTPIRDSTQAVFASQPPYEVISTPTLSSGELDELRGVEKVLDKLYNSGRFCYTLDYLLTGEDSPYSLFLALSKHIAKDLPKDDYTFQRELLQYKGGLPYIKETLRLDYYCSNTLPKPPVILRADRSSEFRAYICGVPPELRHTCEEFCYPPLFGKDKVVLQFDYSCKNRVTGRYAYTVIK